MKGLPDEMCGGSMVKARQKAAVRVLVLISWFPSDSNPPAYARGRRSKSLWKWYSVFFCVILRFFCEFCVESVFSLRFELRTNGAARPVIR